MGQRLTDKTIKLLPAPARGNRVFYDLEVKGFGCRVTAAGGRAFVVNYRRKSDGLERRLTIGSFPDWSTPAAREEAKRLKRSVDGGGDPVGDHNELRAAPTVNDLCDRVELEHLPRKREKTQADYRGAIRVHIRPTLGPRKVAAVTFTDVDALHRAITQHAPYQANRVIALVSKMFSLAVKWGWRIDNPARGIERNDEAKRRRYLSGEELIRLTVALAAHADQQAANIFRLLLWTGARKGEVRQAKWADINLDKGEWTKPGATTKQRTDHTIPLSAPARQLLAGIARTNSPYVFPSRRGDGPRAALKDNWAQICRAANITGLRIHDLRHSYASQLASAGVGLHVIGALLGHTQPSTTHRYAHLLDDPLRAATERAGAILSGKPKGGAVPLGRRR